MKIGHVRINPKEPKSLVMVCDCAYDNVPQRIFGRAPMRHAVLYSTGQVGLISPDEFAKLDLSDLVDLRTLTASSPR